MLAFYSEPTAACVPYWARKTNVYYVAGGLGENIRTSYSDPEIACGP